MAIWQYGRFGKGLLARGCEGGSWGRMQPVSWCMGRVSMYHDDFAMGIGIGMGPDGSYLPVLTACGRRIDRMRVAGGNLLHCLCSR